MFKIGNKVITNDSSTYVIAEVGVNHNGDMNLAKKSIDVAAKIGADAVKFQTFKAEKLVSKNAKKAKYQVQNDGVENESQLEMLKKLELSFEDYITLKEYCEEKGIEFLSTPFDPESAEFLNEIGIHAFKIGSGDLTNLPLLRKIAKMKVPVILSTGMSNLSEIEEALVALEGTDVAILHCTSVYPAPYDEVNLKAMDTIKHAFKKIVGYSDHTLGNEVSIAAVAMGAKILEKHFTLDRDLPGPDHKASLNPDELSELIKGIRNIEKSFGNGNKVCTPSEADTRVVARKSIVLVRDMKQGETITENDIVFKRPGNGIQPKFENVVLGATLKKDVDADNVLNWDDII